MPLILAIVADHHQAAQITALIKRLNVDLVQAAEVGEGLLALNDRIPDLVLTSPLMSPFDDGVLDEYLRDLGSAGAHVQSLRIPVLSTSTKKSKRGGFSLFGRAKETHTLEGCDPKVFADEITQYLTRAAEEKQNADENQAQGGLPESVLPGDDWSTTPGPSPVVEAEEKWDPLAWQADAGSVEADSPAPLYNPIESVPAFSSVEGDSPYPSFEGGETTTPEELQAADAPAADIYVPEPAIEAPPPLIVPEAEPPAVPAFDATAYTPIEEEPAAISAIVEDPTPASSPDPDEPVVRAPLSLFTGVEATTDPTEYLRSMAAEPIVPEPIVQAPIVPEPIVRAPIVLESIVRAPIVAEPTVPEPLVAEPMAAEEIVAEPIAAEEIVAEPMAAEPLVAEPIVAAPPEPEATSVPLPDVPSIEDIEAAPAPEPIAPVVAAAIPDPPAAPPESPPPVAEKHAPKLTASFRSALAAIRAAWDAPAKPKPPVVEKPTETMAPAKAEAPIPVKVASQGILGLRETIPIEATPASESMPAIEAPPAEPAAAFGVDSTGNAELIDGEAATVQPREPAVDVGRLAEPEGEASEVYELTVEPDLQELESKLLAPLAPRVARPSPSEEPLGHASETRSGEGRGTKDAPRAKRGKSKKGNKAAAAKPRRQDKGPVQDEWGIFDPDRCGFAALVDKLEEVSEEKEQAEQAPRKGTKVRVISYS
ncbi:MAG TPA: hypothetical protein VFO58_14355 [Vicinamibacterales bacterium]|nr:hypothetical protein [Vicinamibacterales bacterium]